MSYVKHLKTVILILFVSICLNGCSTPYLNDARQPSFDGNEQTAGVIGFLPDGSVEISPGGRETYNSLIEAVGSKTQPVTYKDFGVHSIDNGNYSFTKQAIDRWDSMNVIYKENLRDKVK